MRATLLTLLITLSLIGTALADGPEPIRLDLDELVTMGLKRNLDLRAARADLAASTWAKRGSYIAFLPQGAISSSVTRVDDKTLEQSNQAMTGMARLFENMGISGIEMDPFLYRDTYRTSLTVDQEFPLNLHLLGGRRMAVAAEEASRQGLAVDRDQLILNLRSAAFRLLAARELVQVAEEGAISAENRLLLARDRTELGQINRAESLQWDVALADARSRLIAARNGALLAEMALNRLLGQDLRTPLEIVVGDDHTGRGRVLYELGAEALAARVIGNSPGARALRAGKEISAAGKSMAFSGLIPSLHFQFKYGWRENDTLALDDYESWSATALVRIPLFDLGSGLAKYRQRAAEKRRSDLTTDSALEDLRLGVFSAWHEVQLCEESLRHHQYAEEQAQESFDLMSDRRELGHITEFDLVDVQTALTAARARTVSSRYNYYIALASLECLLGDDKPNLDRRGVER
ncbi:MAG: TolC family protein [bacterium]|nr:TolC family protein [bacterium]